MTALTFGPQEGISDPNLVNVMVKSVTVVFLVGGLLPKMQWGRAGSTCPITVTPPVPRRPHTAGEKGGQSQAVFGEESERQEARRKCLK